jgi:uncharacterized RDD family membrane protein YckC
VNEEPASAPPAAPANVTGPRIVAAFIDIISLFIVFVIMAALFGDAGSNESEDGFNLNLEGGPALIYFIIVFGYYFLLETVGGQTLGKKLMGLKVVAVDGRLTPAKVIVRTLLRIIDALPAFYLLGVILVAVSSKNQRLGDMAAGTLVVRA